DDPDDVDVVDVGGGGGESGVDGIGHDVANAEGTGTGTATVPRGEPRQRRANAIIPVGRTAAIASSSSIPRRPYVDDGDSRGDVDTRRRTTTETYSRHHDRVVLRMLSPSPGGGDGCGNDGDDGEGEGDGDTPLEEFLSSILRGIQEDEDDGGEIEEVEEVVEGKGGDKRTSMSASSSRPSPLMGLHRLVGLYNFALTKYSSCSYVEALDVVQLVLSTTLEGTKRDDAAAAVDRRRRRHDDDYIIRRRDIVTRIAFLAIDCYLALYAGDGRGPPPSTIVGGGGGGRCGAKVDVEEILSWIEKCLASSSSISSSSSSSTPAGVGGMDEDAIVDASSSSFPSHSHSVRHSSEDADELKFRLHLYRSRMLFVGAKAADERRGGRAGGHRDDDADGRTRAARKELKNAMDIYQNRLCVFGGGDDGGGEGTEGGDVGRDQRVKRGTGGENSSRQQQVGNGRGGKGRSPQDASETTSVTSMAGGSLVTSASDAFWSEGKSGGGGGAATATTTRATFEGMPSKNAAAPVSQQMQRQQQSPKLIVSSVAATAATKTKKKGGTTDLRMRHESVLYLKANLEYLRGNTTKSLKLCAEARSAGRKGLAIGRPDSSSAETFLDLDGAPGGDDAFTNDAPNMIADDKIVVEAPSDPNNESQAAIYYGDALYYNNLALLHQTEGRFHLALWYYTQALYYIERARGPSSCNFWSNGVVRPDVTAEILNNNSLCAYQAQEFLAAYSSMARCVRMSPSVFGMRARCWLRLAQSCIGIYVRNQESSDTNEEVNSHDDRLHWIELGSEKDMSNISKNPLPRASRCLYRALHLSAGHIHADADDPSLDEFIPTSPQEGSANVDMDCYEMALVSLAYVKLQQGDHDSTQEITSIVFRLGRDKADDSGKTQSSHTHILAQVYHRDAMILAGST
ncbi:hypothetical protein ACHAXA_001261, partial [Cyclostephanos tholiformis]